MGKDMKYTFKLDPQNPDHVAVSEILDSLGRGEKRKLLVAAILAYDGTEKNPSQRLQQAYTKEELKTLIAEMLDERLGRKGQQSPNTLVLPGKKSMPKNTDPQDADGTIQDDILKGLGGFRS